MVKLQIKAPGDAFPPHPSCQHGPTVLFYQETEDDGFYACAAYRDKRSCSFQLTQTKYNAHRTSNKQIIINKKTNSCQNLSDFVYYCHICNKPLTSAQLSVHLEQSHAYVELNEESKQDPTKFLRALNTDVEHAQYFFDEKALKYFVNIFQTLGISKVICMGAPRLHSYLRIHFADIHSYLLDFDQRFGYFFSEKEYAWFNMCNNHFFIEEQRLEFEKFIKCKSYDRLLIFTDPPFGCRTELIASTLRQLTTLHNSINNLAHQPLPICWIFPYYSAHYIQSQMPELDMCDYKVNYTNHEAYTDAGQKSRKLGSPVRIFTNIPLSALPLPEKELYTFCQICARYVSQENRHCYKCGICPSKNGANYKHCEACGVCVKPYYVHCHKCRRCTQTGQHKCAEYQHQQRCWICRQLGHTELNCMLWQRLAEKYVKLKRLKLKQLKTKQIVCLLCGKLGQHNERSCRQRLRYLFESSFLSIPEPLQIKS